VSFSLSVNGIDEYIQKGEEETCMKKLVLYLFLQVCLVAAALSLSSCETIKTDSERGQYINPAF
jgi:hypothetical protein